MKLKNFLLLGCLMGALNVFAQDSNPPDQKMVDENQAQPESAPDLQRQPASSEQPTVPNTQKPLQMETDPD